VLKLTKVVIGKFHTFQQNYMVSRSENLPIDDQTCQANVTQVLRLNADGLIELKSTVGNGVVVPPTASHKPDCISEAKNKK